MLLGPKRRRLLGGGAALFVCFAMGLSTGPTVAGAAGPPVVGEAWASSVFSLTARLQARIDPNGLSTGYHFDFIPRVAYDANLAGGKDPFTGGSRVPVGSDASLGSGSGFVTTSPLQASVLSPDTAYRYRVVATNSAGIAVGAALPLRTQATGGSLLPDGRGWEMVSPVFKNGGEVEPPRALAGGGVLQAAASGQAITYGSAASFGEGAQGAATASQYFAIRVSGGWATQNITAPLFSGTYGTQDEGVPYQLFSGDLARGLLLNGQRCRGEGTGCAVANPPLLGSGAPAGYQNYYLLEGGGYTALLGAAEAAAMGLEPSEFELRLAGASPDLRHVVLSTCAALTADATEVPLGGGCDPLEQNLYEYSPGAGLRLVNLLPAQSQGTPGAALAAQNAVSADGFRVYWTVGGNLYLREGTATKQVDAAAGGGGSFEFASADGTVAYFTKAGHLFRYAAGGAGSSVDLTPSGGVAGVLGASADGAIVYYLTGGGLFLAQGGAVRAVAAAADPSNYPPATGAARVSADGRYLLFASTVALTGYDNKDLGTGGLDSQVYLYDAAGAGSLVCVSCNPTFGRPTGPSSIPGAIPNGSAPGSVEIYKPRVLSAGGSRVFFESFDAIALTDTNQDRDVYQWEGPGVGSCARPEGCVSLISSGRAEGGAGFVDASEDGSDAFFLTDGSLVTSDPGAIDVYDARVGGGFPDPPVPIRCQGDACQPLPSPPVDPTLTTLLLGPGNPAVRYPGASRCKKGYVRRKGKCVKKAGKAGKKRGAKRGRR